jgi:FMN reductase
MGDGSPVEVTLLIGNPRPGSRTGALGHRVAADLLAALDAEGLATAAPEVVDLAEFGAHLPPRASLSLPPDETIAMALATVRRPGLLLVVCPTFKGTYPGLLKLFLDMLPIDGLAATVAVAAMTAGWDRHRGAAEQFLRPLLTELGAAVPVPALSVTEEEFSDLDPVLSAWMKSHAPTLAAVVSRQCHGSARSAFLANDRSPVTAGGS